MQRQDVEPAAVVTYLETGVLPLDEKNARQVALKESQYTLDNQVVYRVEADGTLRVVPPNSQCERLFQEAHSGVFSAHLSNTKIYTSSSLLVDRDET